MSFVGSYTIRNNLGMRYKWSELARYRMKERGVTRERVANMLGKTPGAVGHWLNGRRGPSLTDIASIFQILSLSNVVLHGDGSVSLPDDYDPGILTKDALTVRQKALVELLAFFPEDEQEKMLKELREKKEQMDQFIEKWLKARKDAS